MNATTLISAQQNLAAMMDRVWDDHIPFVITREDDRPAVLISLADYQALTETAYLLRSPKNAKRLLDSIAELESGKGTVRKLVE